MAPGAVSGRYRAERHCSFSRSAALPNVDALDRAVRRHSPKGFDAFALRCWQTLQPGVEAPVDSYRTHIWEARKPMSEPLEVVWRMSVGDVKASGGTFKPVHHNPRMDCPPHEWP